MDESSTRTIKRALDGMMKKFDETARKLDEEIGRRKAWGDYVKEFMDTTIEAIEEDEVIFNKGARAHLLKSARDLAWDDAKEHDHLLKEMMTFRKSIITSWEILDKLTEEIASKD